LILNVDKLLQNPPSLYRKERRHDHASGNSRAPNMSTANPTKDMINIIMLPVLNVSKEVWLA
jgi:hypothetical protein